MYVLVDIRYVIDNYEKTGCNRLQPVFYGFLKFFKLRQPATEPTAKRGNRNRWSGCFRLRSVRFWCFFRFRELDLQTLGTIQFVSLVLGIFIIMSKALPRQHSCRTNLNNEHINCFYSVSPLEQLANKLSK
jgi:hypothetical protein